MGQLDIPTGSVVYLDTAPVIYTVEKHVDYWPILRPVWLRAKGGEITLITSELTLLEVLVAPIRERDDLLIEEYETLLTKTNLFLIPITPDILRNAAALRASQNLRTPDAIHAASAITSGCHRLLTNDSSFRRISQVQTALISEAL